MMLIFKGDLEVNGILSADGQTTLVVEFFFNLYNLPSITRVVEPDKIDVAATGINCLSIGYA